MATIEMFKTLKMLKDNKITMTDVLPPITPHQLCCIRTVDFRKKYKPFKKCFDKGIGVNTLHNLEQELTDIQAKYKADDKFKAAVNKLGDQVTFDDA
ncbi:hypothetical protein GGF41_001552 [Coemansia sp. RSA 2531]|nr:hypothetical protein GGF41_001552 [Coemansia sp. RSA 2531]